MITSQTDYKSIPDLLKAFAKQYKTEHFHIHGGYHHNDTQQTLLSVFQDDTNQLHQGVRLTVKGGLIGLLTGAFYHMQFGGTQTQYVHTRTILGNIKTSRKYPVFAVMGAMAGISWWIIHDMFLCPHGRQSTLQREVLAHAIQGGLVLGAIYHPSAIGYGMIVGAFTGLFRDAVTTPKLPKNFMLYFSNFDQQKRMNKLRDDEQYELSIRQVLDSQRVFHPI